ncbi:MAG TPA: SAM-dependent methyltransferase [Gammaproteobacteria bacterium]|nr:SAM-dependent methyltransferase [Gammaproteobacteria bacterium]
MTGKAQHAIANLPSIKAKMKATWEDGNYAKFSTYMEEGATDILNEWNIKRDAVLLDIGCGSGQTAIPAARSGMNVTGIDLADNLIDYARERARFEDLSARFDVGDAASLPYNDNQFDVVISLIGAMFAPEYNKTASEMARVCQAGGRLHMANWTPDSFAASMFKCVAKYAPPPAGIESPALWGDEVHVIERLGEFFTGFKLERQYYPHWTYPFDIKELVQLFREQFGPVKRAFDSLDENGQNALLTDLEDIFQAHNIATDGTTEIKGRYLNISATKK